MITKNYIKMCEKAEEIQKLWKPKVGDWIYFAKLKKIFLVTIVKKEIVEYIEPKTREDSWCYKENIKTYFIWLPTQEQLQKMIDAYTDYERANRFHEFIGLDAFEYGWDKWCEFVNGSSMNELWLVFVMHEKYNKTWTGEKWVKE